MPRTISRWQFVAVCLGAFALALALWGSSLSVAKKSGNPAASSLKTLVVRTSALPKGSLPQAKRNGLQRAARHALFVAPRRPCAAVKDLGRFRRILLGVRVSKAKNPGKAARKIAALGPISLKASSRLLAGKRTKSCGGGVKPSRLSDTQMKVLKSDANGMKVQVRLPVLHFVPKTGGGKTWTQLVLANTDSPGDPGTPGIPVASNILGVPSGAKVVVKAGDVDSYTLDGINVFPAQPDPVDADTKAPDFDKAPFATKPFTLDKGAYNTKGLQPPAPADGGIIGDARDLTIGNLTIPAVQFNAKTQKVKVLTSVIVNIAFEGGPHTFSNEPGSPWEYAQRRLVGSLLNSKVVSSRWELILRRCGEEMLVITNPATRPAADTFAVARRAAGFRTTVVETGAAKGQIGTTPAEIQTFIRGRLTAPLCIHPSYITIMGDDDLVPTFTDGPSGIPSDLKYSLRNDADELPDVAVGRIIGDNQAQVGAAVTKIIGYETTAPAGDFLKHATVAAQFQDDDNDGQENRTFITFAETVRNGLVARGVTVDRIYGEHPGNNPQKFQDGTPLPASLKKPTFGWNGTGAQVSEAWNAGRFLMIHRDHGWSDGWGTPGYGTGDVNALTNGSLLPVVMSINCSSGAYDYDETSFAGSALVKPDGGAVGVFGDTRDSPSTANTQISLGFVDALLPSILPAEGPATSLRVGDALIHGKLRLNGISPGSGTTRSELYLWHYFGDPSMQMWGGGSPPKVFDPGLFKAVFKASIPGPPDPPPFLVEVSFPKELAGQTFSLLRDGEVIGKAIAGDGSVAIAASFGDGSVKPGELKVALEADGVQPISIPVDSVPPAATTLEQFCPREGTTGSPLTIKGTLAGAPAGSTLNVTFTPPAGTGAPQVVAATTAADGSWSASVTPTPNQPGTWSVSSHYAGTSQYSESKAGPCTTAVGSPIG
jgi:hypothetical protein